MKSCTFFGHRNCPDRIELELYNVIKNLITKESVDRFYVGNQGNFDCVVCRILDKLRKQYTHIQCYIVLAYMPSENNVGYILPTIFPEGLERVPRKFAVLRRNSWMIDNSQFAVTYVKRCGGAARFSEIAEKKGLTIMNID